jgi:phosphohistidine phosphatase SixA
VRLFLVRHDKAAPGEPGEPDELRPLTKSGQTAARDLGARLAREHVDAVVSSPLLRARETAEAIARASDVELELDERLEPGTNLDAVRAVVQGRGETVVVVGHQPDLSEITFALTGRIEEFKPGAVLELEL